MALMDMAVQPLIGDHLFFRDEGYHGGPNGESAGEEYERFLQDGMLFVWHGEAVGYCDYCVACRKRGDEGHRGKNHFKKAENWRWQGVPNNARESIYLAVWYLGKTQGASAVASLAHLCESDVAGQAQRFFEMAIARCRNGGLTFQLPVRCWNLGNGALVHQGQAVVAAGPLHAPPPPAGLPLHGVAPPGLGVQDLAERVSTLEGQVASLEEENGELRRRLGDIEARLQTWSHVSRDVSDIEA